MVLFFNCDNKQICLPEIKSKVTLSYELFDSIIDKCKITNGVEYITFKKDSDTQANVQGRIRFFNNKYVAVNDILSDTVDIFTDFVFDDCAVIGRTESTYVYGNFSYVDFEMILEKSDEKVDVPDIYQNINIAECINESIKELQENMNKQFELIREGIRENMREIKDNMEIIKDEIYNIRYR